MFWSFVVHQVSFTFGLEIKLLLVVLDRRRHVSRLACPFYTASFVLYSL